MDALSSYQQFTPPEQLEKQLSYILIENPSKSNNLGPILRCATAFAVDQVIFVGYDKCSIKGSHGASKYVNIKAFVNFEQAVKYLRESCGVVSIVGILGDVCLSSGPTTNNSCLDRGRARALVGEDEEYNVVKVTGVNSHTNEVVESKARYPLSDPVHERPFPSKGNVCFSISRRSIGLPIHQAQYCDAFLHVQTGVASSAPSTSSSIEAPNLIYGLLDSQTCLSITLHHFNIFAKYDERVFEGQKFQVARNQVKGQMHFDKDAAEVRSIRLERKEQLRREAMEMDAFDVSSIAEENHEEG